MKRYKTVYIDISYGWCNDPLFCYLWKTESSKFLDLIPQNLEIILNTATTDCYTIGQKQKGFHLYKHEVDYIIPYTAMNMYSKRIKRVKEVYSRKYIK